MSIEVHLFDGETVKFKDPDRPGDFTNVGDEVTGVKRCWYHIGGDQSLTIVIQTIDATHGHSHLWTDATVTEEDSDPIAYFRPFQWTHVRVFGKRYKRPEK